MLQFDLQFYEELTVAWVRTVKFISGAFFWPTGQLVYYNSLYSHSWSTIQHCAHTSKKYYGKKKGKKKLQSERKTTLILFF